MPLLAVALARVPRAGAGRAVTAVLLAASLAFGALAVLGGTSVFGRHPLELVLRLAR